MIHRWILALFLLLGAGPSVIAQGESALPQPGYEATRGGRLNLEVEAAGGKLQISALDFYQQIRKTPGGSQTRTLFPTQIQISASGVQQADYSAIPMPEGDGWFSQTKVRANLDQQTEISIDPSAFDLGAFGGDGPASDFVESLEAAERYRRAANVSPITVRIIEAAETDPVIEIRLRSLPSIPPAGVTVVHVANSKITETRTTTSPTLPAGEKPLVTTHSRDYELPLDVQIGTTGRGASSHSNLLPPQLLFQDTEVRTVGTLSGNRVLASGTASQTSAARLTPDTLGGFGDALVVATWNFAIGEPPDVAWLECADPSPETWMPAYGTQRRFAVHLKEPKKVKGIRFLLEQVSAHPGVAINAGVEQVASKTRAKIVQIVPVKLTEGEAELRWSRTYRTFDENPEDNSPDLLFEQHLNKDHNLPGSADQLVAHQVSNPTIATVSVRDWAASGVIRAEVLVDGFWEAIKAKGPGLSVDQTSLQLPLDENRNSIADAFERGLNADADDDALSWFEEYRGAYVRGIHERFNAAREDYFLIDYAGLLNDATFNALDQRFNPYEIDLHLIWTSEHAKETVGSSSGVVVFEPLRQNALPAVLSIANASAQKDAWRALRPHPGTTTIFLDGTVPVNLIAYDLMRLWDFNPKSD